MGILQQAACAFGASRFHENWCGNGSTRKLWNKEADGVQRSEGADLALPGCRSR